MKRQRGISVKTMLCTMLMAWGVTLMTAAQDQLRRTLMSMPDSIVPFLNHSMMGELLEFAGRGGTAEVKNKLDGMTSLDTLLSDYAAFSLTKVDKMHILLLPRVAEEPIVCMVHSCYGPEPESTVSFFSTDWKRLPNEELLTAVTVDELLQRPDTMTMDRFLELRRLIDPCLVFVDVIPQERALVFSLSKPLLTEEDKKALHAVVVQKTIKWNGNTFK